MAGPKSSTTTDANPAGDTKTPAVPEDLRSLYADKISYRGDRTVIKFRGRTFSFPTSRAEWPTLAFQAFQRQRHADGIEIVLGPQQWAKLNAVAPKIKDFWEFVPLFTVAAGFVDLGDEKKS